MSENPVLQLLSQKARQHYQGTTIHDLYDQYPTDNQHLTKRDREKLAIVAESMSTYYRSPKMGTALISTTHAMNFMAPLLSHKDQEELLLVLLNNKNQVIHTEIVFKGSLSQSIAHPREILRAVIKHPTARFMLAHNHPSGNNEPSRADMAFTERMIEASHLIGIDLLDHIIIAGDNDHLSLRETDALPFY